MSSAEAEFYVCPADVADGDATRFRSHARFYKAESAHDAVLMWASGQLDHHDEIDKVVLVSHDKFGEFARSFRIVLEETDGED